ncbi:MAG TPA: prepilin-type N-terminal cleavage/methylation domain-containing protein [Candidatus Paceibacterota bacterium]
MSFAHKTHGFSLTEVIVVVAILGILMAIGVGQYMELRETKKVEQTTETIVAHLEKAKSESLAGKYAEPHGVKFNSSSYEAFIGATYPGSYTPTVYTVDSSVQLSTTLSGNQTIIFERLNGFVGSTATVTVSLVEDSTVYKQIVVNQTGAVEIVR